MILYVHIISYTNSEFRTKPFFFHTSYIFNKTETGTSKANNVRFVPSQLSYQFHTVQLHQCSDKQIAHFLTSICKLAFAESKGDVLRGFCFTHACWGCGRGEAPGSSTLLLGD
mmetsp:Transcript_37694/g.58640  ORF Transcript_37694/g.58640 Transcript_37694/m.58640 type:complete len:113 (-) Transcript_37694:173-511(-)